VRRLQREVDEEREEQRTGHPPGGWILLSAAAGVAPSGLTAAPRAFSLNAVKKSSAIFLATPSINTRADLGELAADGWLWRVSQTRARAFCLERDLRAALAESRGAAEPSKRANRNSAG